MLQIKGVAVLLQTLESTKENESFKYMLNNDRPRTDY